jgi:xanthine dehydrogenase accessory factor
VVAATPVGVELLRWGPEVGFRTLLLETRADRLAGRDWPQGRILKGPAELDAVGGTELFVVHTDHDAPDLVELLERVLSRSPRFVGLMGSRRHTGHHLDALAARGMDPGQIERVQSPVGLDIGAQTPAEIALSILAGLVAARRGRTGGWLEARC